MGPEQKNEIETRPANIPKGKPSPERTSFAFGSLVFGTLSLLAALFLNLTTFGAIMGAMGLGYAMVARSSQRRLIVLAGAAISLAGLLVSLWRADVF